MQFFAPGVDFFCQHRFTGVVINVTCRVHLQNLLKIGVSFQSCFDRTTPSSGRGSARRATPRAAQGVFFKMCLKTDPHFRNRLNIYAFFHNTLNICQPMFSKWPQIQVFKTSGFSQGRRMPPLRKTHELVSCDRTPTLYTTGCCCRVQSLGNIYIYIYIYD